MTARLRSVLVAGAAVATLAFAHAAVAANTATLSVTHTPMVLAGSQSTTINVKMSETNDAIAAVDIFVPAGYGAALNAPAETRIGTVDSEALAHDTGQQLPLGGPITTDDPAKHTTDICSPGTNMAVWNLNLGVAGQTLVVPAYVNPTSGPSTALGAYDIRICLPPWDVPAGAPGRAFEGAQLLTSTLTVNKIFTTPTSPGLLKWEALITPYNRGQGTPNRAATFEARAFVPIPVILGLHASYAKKTNTWKLSGTATQGGLPVAGLPVKIARGSSAKSLSVKSSTTTGTNGAWKSSGHLKPKKTTYFQVSGAFAKARDYTSTGCQSPLTTVAPAGCASATLSPWTAKSVVVRVKP
jgi:hypothetical protein